jgi:NADH-quinone oxidoreductase subunit L
VLAELSQHFHGATALGLHAVLTIPFWLMVAGFAIATFVYLFRPRVAELFSQRLPFLYRLLDHKYYFDEFYQKIFAQGGLRVGQGLWKRADAGFIDGFLVNGSARAVNWVAARVRRWQTGYLYDYAFAMIIGLIAILAAWVVLY